MKVHLKTKYFDEEVTITKATYGDTGATALTAKDQYGDPFTTFSVYLDDPGVALRSPDLPKDHCFFKNYSENEGFLECLEQAGLIKRTGVTANTGYVRIPVVKILF